MEIRANYILVGIFAIAVMLGILCAILWLNKDSKNVAMETFDIEFKESVRGLSIGNPVMFSGIRVGQVTGMTISESEPGAVQVRIVIRADTPVREDSLAKLDLMGLTGGSMVSITGGSATSPLVPHNTEAIRFIQAQPSALDSVMKDAPNALALANNVLSNMEKILSEENQEQISVILASSATLSSTMAKQSEKVDAILSDAQSTVSEINKAMKTLNTASARMDSILASAAPEVNRISTETMPQVRMLMVEVRQLVQSLNRISQNFDSDPKRYLFGDSVKEYSAQ